MHSTAVLLLLLSTYLVNGQVTISSIAASPGTSVSVDTTVTVTPTVTDASGGTTFNYEWTQSSGPATATVTSVTDKSPSISGLSSAGDYVFSLTADNGAGDSDTATITITVGSSGVCLSGEDMVNTARGERKVKDLKIGDAVQVAQRDGSITFEPIHFNFHPPNNLSSSALRLHTTKGRTLTLTDEHLLFEAPRCLAQSFKAARSVKMKDLRVEDCVYYVRKRGDGRIAAVMDRITAISPVNISGLYNPMTPSGTIVVNGVVVSNYAYMVDHQMAHQGFKAFHELPEYARTMVQRMFDDMTETDKTRWLSRLGMRMVLSNIDLTSCSKDLTGKPLIL